MIVFISVQMSQKGKNMYFIYLFIYLFLIDDFGFFVIY